MLKISTSFLLRASTRLNSTSATSAAASVVKKQDTTPLPQSANRATPWSKTQQPKAVALSGPRFEQTDLAAQPSPMAAIELINAQPVKVVHTRIASCDGGGGALGHPKVYINLDALEPRACGYCGNKFKLEHAH